MTESTPRETWRYSHRDGLYYQDGVGPGLTFDEVAARSDYVAGHDDAPRVIVDFGEPIDEPEIDESEEFCGHFDDFDDEN